MFDTIITQDTKIIKSKDIAAFNTILHLHDDSLTKDDILLRNMLKFFFKYF